MQSAVFNESSEQAATGDTDRIVQLLTRGLDELESRYGLKPAILASQKPRIEELLRASIDSDHHLPDSDSAPWGWQPAIESPELAVGKLTVWQGQDIPLHDHPGSTGLLVVMQGQVQIRSYKPVVENDQAQPPLELEMTANRVIGVGDYWHFGPYENNIHSLQAIDGNCVLFDVLFSPYQLQQRTFYMPIVPNNEARNIFVTPLTKLRNRSIH